MPTLHHPIATNPHTWLVCFLVHYLATHASLQAELRRRPGKLAAAGDEILRLHAPLIANRRVHVCPGAPLARLELRVLMETLLAGTSGISLVSYPPPRLAAFPDSGFSSLQVRLQ